MFAIARASQLGLSMSDIQSVSRQHPVTTSVWLCLVLIPFSFEAFLFIWFTEPSLALHSLNEA